MGKRPSFGMVSEMLSPISERSYLGVRDDLRIGFPLNV